MCLRCCSHAEPLRSSLTGTPKRKGARAGSRVRGVEGLDGRFPHFLSVAPEVGFLWHLGRHSIVTDRICQTGASTILSKAPTLL